MKKSPNKIFILGTSGSGKTTLAEQISEKLNIPHYNLDDLFWYKRFSKKRNPKKRNLMILNVLKKKKWVTEGVYGFWTEKFTKESDLVIWLDFPFRTLLWRNIQRFLTEKEKRPNEDIKNLFRIIK
ncbi:MAG: AAA family ATPase, partial [Nanoarchaeota archaeon]|nr:AAA family ATPase [Nanoarchaeota archaeon]